MYYKETLLWKADFDKSISMKDWVFEEFRIEYNTVIEDVL